ncbi:hypothetical protein IHQ56_02740 [Methylobacillus flagellatus]|uniref:hypothetical protein n=1 Tax=Methylobacillus flagellatus TaxID=405 RepID=UPI0028540794|nr:hypothetical protein [Methylobacillus flagellatus]MDR5170727.1 hypothetical protein [Methylobacillus flagellatus]
MTIAEHILQHIYQALLTGNIGASVYRARTDSFALSELPAVNLKPATEGTRTLGNGLKANELDIELDVHVADTPPDGKADEVISIMHAAITTYAPLLEMVAEISYQSREWEFDEGDEQRGKVTVRYTVTYDRLSTVL